MKTIRFFGMLLMAVVLSAGMTACGGGDSDDEGGGGGSGGGGGTSTFSIVGTWKYFFKSNDPSRGEVYNLVTFNSDHSGTLIEEVGYGSDKPNAFTWTQSGNTVTIAFSQSVYETWTIVQVIDNNTAVVSNGKKQFTFYRDGTGGGGNSGGGSGGGTEETVKNLKKEDILGTWQVYYAKMWGTYDGQSYEYSWDVSPKDSYSDAEPTCDRYIFNADGTYMRREYYKGDWLPHGPYHYQISGSNILTDLSSPNRYFTVNKLTANEMVMTEHNEWDDGCWQWFMNRVQDSGSGGGSDSGGTVVNDTINHPMTVSEIYDIVAAMPKDEVSFFNHCVKGKVCSVKYPFSVEYGTAVFNISDNGYTGDKEFTVYNAYYKNFDRKWTTGDTQVTVGDEVVVFGKVVNYKGTTPEFVDKRCCVVYINGK